MTHYGGRQTEGKGSYFRVILFEDNLQDSILMAAIIYLIYLIKTSFSLAELKEAYKHG